jgi:hypothetical protein
MLIGRAITGLDVRQPDLRIYLSDTRKAGRSAREWDVKASCPYHPGTFRGAGRSPGGGQGV